MPKIKSDNNRPDNGKHVTAKEYSKSFFTLAKMQLSVCVQGNATIKNKIFCSSMILLKGSLPNFTSNINEI